MELTFNGVRLDNFFRIKDVRRGVGPSMASRTASRRNKKGVRYLGFDSSMYEIEVDVRVHEEKHAELVKKRQQISAALNVTEPKYLMFGDEADRFYMAKPKERFVFEETVFLGDFTIVFEVPDGVAYSTDIKSFKNNGTDHVTVRNTGTDDMILDLQAIFSDDCGYLALQTTDELNRLLFGRVEEVDGVTTEVTQLLFDDHFIKDPGWTLNNGITPPVTGERKQVGSVKYQYDQWQPGPKPDPNEGFARPDNWGTGNSWHGPTLTKTVPADRNGKYAVNWGSSYRIDFNQGSGDAVTKARKVGHNSVSYIDENDNIIVSIVFEDNTAGLESTDMAVYIDGKRVWDVRNMGKQFYITGRQPWVSVQKIGAEINIKVNYADITKTFRTNRPNATLRKVTWYAAQYKTFDVMPNNLIRALNVRKFNVEKWTDLTNTFEAGDTLTYGYEGANRFVRLNNLNAISIRDVGSTDIIVPPGDTDIYIAKSSFATMPQVTLSGRFRYI